MYYYYVISRSLQGTVNAVLSLNDLAVDGTFNTNKQTSLKLKHILASNRVWMFPGLTPTTFVKFGMLPLLEIELLVILCNLLPILRFEKNFKQVIR